MLRQHASTSCFQVKVFGKYHSDSITKLMGGQKVELPTSVVNVFMQLTNFVLRFSVPLIFWNIVVTPLSVTPMGITSLEMESSPPTLYPDSNP